MMAYTARARAIVMRETTREQEKKKSDARAGEVDGTCHFFLWPICV
jgi:hypothetical protein